MKFYSLLVFATMMLCISALKAEIEQKVKVKDKTYTCLFKMRYEENICLDTSKVSCSPKIMGRKKTVNDVKLDLADGTIIYIEKLRLLKRKKAKIIGCTAISPIVTNITENDAPSMFENSQNQSLRSYLSGVYTEVNWGFNKMKRETSMISVTDMQDLMSKAQQAGAMAVTAHPDGGSYYQYSRLIFLMEGTASPTDESWPLYIRGDLVAANWKNLGESSAGETIKLPGPYIRVNWGFNKMKYDSRMTPSTSLMDLMSKAQQSGAVACTAHPDITYQYSRSIFRLEGTAAPTSQSWPLYIRSDLVASNWRDLKASSAGETIQLPGQSKCLSSFESIGYPDNYPNRVDASVTISVTAGHAMEITFEDFNVEYGRSTCPYDYVQFYDDYGNTVGKKLCGTTLPSKFSISTSTSTVHFHTDSSVTKKGFKFCYKENGAAAKCKHTDTYTGCPGWKTPYCTNSWALWMATNCAKTCKC